MKQILKTQEVIERLAIRYCSPAYGFITQVRSGAGAYGGRTADALAMSLWPSRGLHLIGFEVKVSRTDWLKELSQPAKAEEIAAYCPYWYIAVGDETIIKPGELPQNWGLIVPHGKGLRVAKEAPFKKEATAMDLIFMAGIFRNIADYCVPKEVIQKKFDEHYEKGKEWGQRTIKDQLESLEKYKTLIKNFEESSGVKLDAWHIEDNKKIGEAVRVILEGREHEGKERLEKILDRTRNIVKFLEGQKISNWDM